MPEISVIMGTFNGENRIGKSIESILNQSFQDFELIICDDASVDKTVEVIKKYMLLDNRIILIQNSINMKLSATLNKCLSVAKGNYIARIDDDDIAYYNRLQIQLDFFKKHPEIDILGTSRNLYDNNGIWGHDIRKEKAITATGIALGESFIHPSVMMRKECLNKVNGYTTDKMVERTEDLDLWFKLFVEGYKGYCIPNVLLDYYEDLGSYTRRKYKYRINEYKVRRYWTKKMNLSLKCKLYAYRSLIVGLLPKKILLKSHINRYMIKK